jgi:DNA polymerase epsilon subunit 1
MRSQLRDWLFQDDTEAEVDAYLRRKYTTNIRDVEAVFREDLDLKNHLSGLQRKLLKVKRSCQ